MIQVHGAAVQAAEFRSACALFPTGVTIVTRKLANGRAYGMTVSSFTSVSLDPPLILVCIDKRAGFLAELERGAFFAVSVLREDQQPVAVRFSRQPEASRFEGIEWSEGSEGVPLLGSVVASFVCRLRQSVEAGDHFVLIGEVREIFRNPGLPLIWCVSGYHCLPRPVGTEG